MGRSSQRSADYYRTKEGRTKKRIQNDKRRRQPRHVDGEDPGKEKSSADSACEATEGQWNEQMVTHVRMVTSLIEGRQVSREEILQMLERAMRQHSIGRERRIDYVVRSLMEDPG